MLCVCYAFIWAKYRAGFEASRECSMNERLTNKLLAAGGPRPVQVCNSRWRTSPFLLGCRSCRQFDAARARPPRSRRGGIAAPHRLGYRHRRARPPCWRMGLTRCSSSKTIRASSSIATGRLVRAHRRFRTISESTAIPGNAGLTKTNIRPRARAKYSGLPWPDRSRAGAAAAGRPCRGAGLAAQFHAGLQRRGAALACRGPLQSRSAFRPPPHRAS